MPRSKADQPAPDVESRLLGFAREVRAAALSLLRQPRYSIPSAISVALGIGASLAVFAVFSALMLRPLPFPDPERLVRVGFAGANPFNDPEDLAVSYPLVERLRQHSSIFESVSEQGIYAARFQNGGEPARWVEAEPVALDFFDTLGATAIEGRLFTARDPGSGEGFVMRHGYWQNELGGKPDVGQVVLIDGSPKTFIGVIADEQALPSFGGIWMTSAPADRPSPQSYYYKGFARLARGMTLATARERLAELTFDLQVSRPSGERLRIEVRPLRETLVDAERSWFSVMLVAVFTFLLMACANLAALLATRAAVRQHEWAVCAAVGATRRLLARQSLLEGFLMAALSGFAGLGLAQLGVGWANSEYADALGNLPARIDLRVLGALFVLILVCTSIGSAAPVLVLRRVTPMDALRGEGRSSEGHGAGRLRRALVVVQVAATVLLLINAGLVLHSLQTLLHQDMGFSPENVVTTKVVLSSPPRDDTVASFMAQKAEVERQGRAVLERVRAIPGVGRVGVGRVPFDYASERNRVQLEPGARLSDASVRIQSVGPGYFETLGVGLLSGQLFGPEHDAWPPQRYALVSRNLAREALGVEDAVGHRLRWMVPPGTTEQPPWIQIVGMVEDTLEQPLTDPAPLSVYFPYFAYPTRSTIKGNTMLHLALKVTGPADEVMRKLPAAVAEVLPNAPVTQTTTLAALVQNTVGRRVALSQVLLVLAVVALVLAAIGLSGIASYSVARRLRELAIRRALGASQRGIRLLVLRETATLVGTGLLLGIAGAWLSRDLMAAFVQGIGASDPLTYVVVSGAALAITFGAALVATRPIAALSPARALARQ